MTLRSAGSSGHSHLRGSRFTWYRHPFVILLIGLSFRGDGFHRISIGSHTGALADCCGVCGAGSDHDRDHACVKFSLLEKRKRRSINQLADERSMEGLVRA